MPRWCRRWPPFAAAPARPATIDDRVIGLVPAPDREDAWLFDDTRCLEPWDDERRIAVAVRHEHREPLERHRLVAGEPGEVGAHREQQDVDALRGHLAAHPGQAVGVGSGR